MTNFYYAIPASTAYIVMDLIVSFGNCDTLSPSRKPIKCI